MSNETDRELMELAAKAAGMVVEWRERQRCFCYADSPYNVAWNPLTDDGDALRLGAKLQLRTLCTNAGASAESTHRDHPSVFAWGERMDYSDVEASAATRRAIVRAAAEIGRAMP